MSKAIEIQGIVRNTKDSAAKDGGCDELFGMRMKDNSWRPVGDLQTIPGWLTLREKEWVRIFIHTNAYRHVMGLNASGELVWFADIDENGVIADRDKAVVVMTGVGEEAEITQTGHLMAINNNGLHYFLYRPVNDAYTESRTDFNSVVDYRLLPYGNVEFKVERLEDENGRPYYFGDTIEEAGIRDATDYEDRVGYKRYLEFDKGLYAESQVMKDVINKTRNNTTKLNYFTGAFMLCTAAELYDGTFILQSQPVLMLPPGIDTKEDVDSQAPIRIASSLDRYNKRRIKGTTHYMLDQYVNPDHCEKITSDYDIASPMAGSGIPLDIDSLTTGQDLMYCQRNLKKYKQFRDWLYSDNGQSFVGGREKPLQYDKNIVTDTDFSAEAADVWSNIGPGAKLPNAWGIMAIARNIKPYKQVIVNADMDDDITVCYMTGNQLKYRVNHTVSVEYKDIVKNISIFITPQVDCLDFTEAFNAYTVMVDGAAHGTGVHQKQVLRDYKYRYRDIKDIKKELNKQYMFYKIGEIPVEFADADKGKWITLEMEDYTLQNLLTQDRLQVDSVGRDSYDAKVAFPYNNRLHIADYEQKIFEGWLLDHFFYWGGAGQYPESGYRMKGTGQGNEIGWIKVRLENETEGEKIVVRPIAMPTGKSSGKGNTPVIYPKIQSLNPILSYPSKDAKEIEIYIKNYNALPGEMTAYHQTFALAPHDNFNFAYYIAPDLKPIDVSYNSNASLSKPEEKNTTESHHNRVKVSKTNNPLYFPPENTYAIGNSVVLGFGVNADTIPNGQIGNSPLYVFCSDGTYGLFNTSNGEIAYTNANVISRYVCNNAKGICPVIGGVVFPTEQGLVIISGHSAKEIADIAEGKPFDIDVLPQIRSVLGNPLTIQWNKESKEDLREYLKGAIIGYNFYEQELWVCNQEKGYSYICDREGRWSKRKETGVQFVNDFPKTYLLGDTLCDLAKEKIYTSQQTMLLTRAIKFDTQEFKQIHRLIARGEWHIPDGTTANAKVLALDELKAANPFIDVIRINPYIESVYETIIPETDLEPVREYENQIAIADGDALVEIAETYNAEQSVFAALREYFKSNGLIDTGIGWIRTSDDQLQPEYSIYAEPDFETRYGVRVRFGSDHPYKFTSNSIEYSIYCPDGWEGTITELLDVVESLDEYDEIKYKADTDNFGLYIYKCDDDTHSTTGDTLPNNFTTDKNNKWWVLGMERPLSVQTSTRIPLKVYENNYDKDVWVIAGVTCDKIVEELQSNTRGVFHTATNDGLVEINAGDNVVLWSGKRGESASVRFFSTEDVNQTYDKVVQMYEDGLFGEYKETSLTMQSGKYYRVENAQSEELAIVKYDGESVISFAELAAKIERGELEQIEVWSSADPITLQNGKEYDIVFETTPGTRVEKRAKYVGSTATRTIAQWSARLETAEFVEETEEDIARSRVLDVEDGQVYVVLYNGEKHTIVYRGEDQITVGDLIDNIEEGEYAEPDNEKKAIAGIFLYGSYDNSKWALVGQGGNKAFFRDLGLQSGRVDCKYFRILIVGKMMEESSIEYIEAEGDGGYLHRKIR